MRRPRQFEAGCGRALACSAVFSPDGIWRYELRRVWDPTGEMVAFVGLNPSTADLTHDDPTVRRCLGFARSWGYGGLIMLNAFAFRATDPLVMRAASDPVGPDNDAYLRAAAAEASEVVAAWGNHGRLAGRSGQVVAMLGPMSALGITKRGEPRHPLYVRGDAQRIDFPNDTRPRQRLDGGSERRQRLRERLRAEYIAGAEEETRRRTGRPMTAEELERVLRRYPGNV
jgi:hypothetical protein